MPALSRRRRHEEAHGHDERWLITYADMITLLLAVFIVLYSFSVVDLRKFEEVAGALGSVFQGSSGAGTLSGGDGILAGGAGISLNRASLVSDLKCAIDHDLPEPLKQSISLTHRDGVVTISLKADAITFPAGRADLTREVRQMLDAVGPSLREAMLPLLIEGHTCDLPIGTTRFPSNWELSALRATNVMVHLIRNCGIEPDHISAVGYADTRPIEQNDSEQARARNRRVDIVVLTGDDPPGGTNHAGTAGASAGTDSVRLQPVRIRPVIDLSARHYQSTGRRSVDTATEDGWR